MKLWHCTTCISFFPSYRTIFLIMFFSLGCNFLPCLNITPQNIAMKIRCVAYWYSHVHAYEHTHMNTHTWFDLIAYPRTYLDVSYTKDESHRSYPSQLVDLTIVTTNVTRVGTIYFAHTSGYNYHVYLSLVTGRLCGFIDRIARYRELCSNLDYKLL